MITPRSFSERRPFFSRAYFGGLLRRGWPQTVFAVLALFFVLPLPILLQINEKKTWSGPVLSQLLNRMLGENIWICALVAAGMAVLAGIVATRYLTRRASVDYYHSLPIRREGLLFMQWLAGLTHFAAALAVELGLSLVIFAVKADVITPFADPFAMLMGSAGYMLLSFLLFYSLTVFCGLLCGTSLMQAVLTGLSLAVLPLLRALFFAFAKPVVKNVDLGYYADRGWHLISPVARLLSLRKGDGFFTAGMEYVDYALAEPFLWWESALWLLSSGILLAMAMLVYRRRRVERAGESVVFGGVAAAVRWVVTVLSALSLALIFSDLGGSNLFWLFFGMLLGATLGFMLINSLLTKAPRRMLEGWRRLIVSLIVLPIVFVGTFWSLSALDRQVPRHVDRLAIFFGQENYSVPYYEDPAVIAAWQELWATNPAENEYAQMLAAYYENSDGIPRDGDHYFNPEDIHMTVYAEVGPFVIAYEQREYSREDAEALLRAVTESAEFEAGWDYMLEETAARAPKRPFKPSTVYTELEVWVDPALISQISMYGMLADAYTLKTGVKVAPDSKHLGLARAPITKDTSASILAEVDEDIGFDFFQSPIYAAMEIGTVPRAEDARMNDGRYAENHFELFVHASMPSLYREILSVDEEGFYNMLADTILAEHGGVYVAKHLSYTFTLEDDHVMYVTDRAEIAQILRGLAILDTGHAGNYYMRSPFTVYEQDYGVIFPNGNTRSVTYFIRGKVPAFVSERLG